MSTSTGSRQCKCSATATGGSMVTCTLYRMPRCACIAYAGSIVWCQSLRFIFSYHDMYSATWGCWNHSSCLHVTDFGVSGAATSPCLVPAAEVSLSSSHLEKYSVERSCWDHSICPTKSSALSSSSLLCVCIKQDCTSTCQACTSVQGQLLYTEHATGVWRPVAAYWSM